MRVKERFGKKLLVEGNDDQHVIWALCEKFNLLENFDVIDCEGLNSLITQIPVRLKSSEITAVGIIIDADVEIKKRWDSLSVVFSNLGFPIPVALPAEGLIIEYEDIRIGIWIMPNNHISGMLEDFVSFLVPPNDVLFDFAKGTLTSIEQQNISKYQAIYKAKALIHTWLAWQEDPGTPMGLAITKKYLTTDYEICQRLLNWLGNTFT